MGKCCELTLLAKDNPSTLLFLLSEKDDTERPENMPFEVVFFGGSPSSFSLSCKACRLGEGALAVIEGEAEDEESGGEEA